MPSKAGGSRGIAGKPDQPVVSIPTRQIGTEEAIAFLRQRIDDMTDPFLRYEHPERWGIACSQLAVFVTRYPAACFHRRTRKNIGKRRMAYLEQFIATWDSGEIGATR